MTPWWLPAPWVRTIGIGTALLSMSLRGLFPPDWALPVLFVEGGLLVTLGVLEGIAVVRAPK